MSCTILERTAVRGRVNEAAGIIYGVKICGLESKNGRTYTPEALKRAVKLYEGVKVYTDHTAAPESGVRSVRDLVGRIHNVRFERQGLFGDLHVNKGHPMAESILWTAQHEPDMLGLSHHVTASTVRRGDKVVVEEITRVLSVDLVAEPATVAGLFEGLDAIGASAAMRERITRRLAAPMTAKQFAEAIKTSHGRLSEATQPPGWPDNETPDPIDSQFVNAILRVVQGDGTKSEKLRLIEKLLTAWEDAASATVDVDQIIADILQDQPMESRRSVIEAITGRKDPSDAAAFARAIKE